MLFLANVGQKETFELYKKLESFTLNNVETSIVQEDTLYKVVSEKDATEESPAGTKIKDGDEFSDANYYSTDNIYHKLGY